ncbi:aminopeptidase [Inhella sp.]|uniref:aminopeptidase n=1 Tax=Inhella sp. TaxID=1921806 RepID=UPI0035B30515
MKRRALLALPLLGGCAEWRYRANALGSHLDLLKQARPIDDWLADTSTPAALRERLAQAQRLRAFASQALALPDNASYRRYVELPQPAVVWNVVAAPVFAIELKRWCFPVMGCVGYRGYPSKAEAEALAAQLQAEGWDVYSYGVPAYSTLGYSNWLGGDPLLSTFLRGGLPETARLIFHELAHQAAYSPDDSGFNEAYATAVERLGLQAWWAAHPDAQLQALDEAREQRRARWQALAVQARDELRAIYADDTRDRARAKAERFTQLREQIDALAVQDPGYSGYRAWAQAANNAHLALLATYHQRVPAFEALFERLGRHWPDFHAEVARLARLPRAERDALLT